MPDEQKVEDEIQAKGLTERRVRIEDIGDLMDRVTFLTEVPIGTTSTFVHAFLDGHFYLDTGHSACVNPENFDAGIGHSIARDAAYANARNKLWELEGYRLYMAGRHTS